MSRFVVVDIEKARTASNAAAFYLDDGWADEYAGYLIDTYTDEIVYADGGEPEDQTLGRDLSVFVDLLNKVGSVE